MWARVQEKGVVRPAYVVPWPESVLSSVRPGHVAILREGEWRVRVVPVSSLAAPPDEAHARNEVVLALLEAVVSPLMKETGVLDRAKDALVEYESMGPHAGECAVMYWPLVKESATAFAAYLASRQEPAAGGGDGEPKATDA